MSVTSQDIKKIKSLSHLSDAQQEKLSRNMYRRDYRAGEIIFFEGEISRGIWFILRGKVQIIKYSDSGHVQGLCITSRGKCFGGCPLFDSDVNPASAQALDNVSLLIIDNQNRDELAQNDPQFLWVLLQIFSQRLNLLAKLGESLGAWRVSTRINECLVTHSNEQLIVALTHEKIAEMVGTAREVVTRHLNQLEDADVIRTEMGQITILDLEFLKSECITQM